MRYEEYEGKIKKVASVKKVAYRFRILIFSILFVILAIGMTLFSTKGIITSQVKLNQAQYEYGQTIEMGASGFLTSDKNIKYEFSSNGEDWNETFPRHPGNYQVRPFTYNNYGNRCYGEIQSFTIVPKAVQITILSSEVVYGEKPKIQADLAFGDTISSYSVNYDDFSKEKPIVNIDLNSLKIVDQNGDDVSDCYSFSCEEKQITILRRNLQIKMKDYSKIYDGTKMDLSDSTENIMGLLDGDTIVAMPSVSDSFVNVGDYEYTGSGLKIENADGIDVTLHYNLQFTKGNVYIKKRPVTVISDDVSKVYDGKEIDTGNLYVDASTPLIDGDELQFKSLTSNFMVCSDVENEFEFSIVNKSTGVDNSDNYDITSSFGKLNIYPKDLTLDASLKNGAKALYYSDIKYGSTDTYIGFSFGDLGEKDTFEGSCKFVEADDKASYKIQYDYKIMHDGDVDVTSCYNISFNDKVTDKIKKKKVFIELKDFNITYTGKSFDASILNRKSFAIENKTSADDYVNPSFDLFIPADVTDGEQTITVDTKLLKNGNEDVTYQYDLEEVKLKYNITKRPVSVTINSKSRDYNGEVLSSTYSVYNLNEGDKIKVFDKDDKDFQLFDAENTNEKEFRLDFSNVQKRKYSTNESDLENYIHHLSYTILNSEGKDVTSNYDVSISPAEFEIKKQEIAFTVPQMVHWYDGANFNFEEIKKYITYDEGKELNEAFEIKFFGENDYNGINYFSSQTTSDETYYDISNEVTFKIYDKNKNDVTDNFDVKMNFENPQRSLVIKRVKISIRLQSDQQDLAGVPYGTIDEEMNSTDWQSKHVSIEDNNDLKDICVNYGYTYDNNGNKLITTKLEGQDGGLEGYYSISLNDFKLKAPYNEYGYKDITKDMIHLTLRGGEPIIKIVRRKINFSLKSTTYWYNNQDEFNPSRIEQILSEDDNDNDNDNDSPYQILSISNSNSDEGLASGNRFEFSLKDGVNLNQEGEYDFKDILNWKIVNGNRNDVTNNYTDGTNPYKSSDSSVLTGTLTIKVPKIALKKIDFQPKPYDGKKRDTRDDLYEIDTNYGNECPNPDSIKLVSEVVDETSDSDKNYTSGRVGTYSMKLSSISFKWNRITYKYDFKNSSEKQGMEILNLEDKSLFVYNLIIQKATLKISMKETIDDWIYSNTEPDTSVSKAYYYTYDGKYVTLEQNPEDEKMVSINKSLNIDGLAAGDEIKFYAKGKGLPSEASEEPYDLNEYFGFKIYKEGTNEDVTDFYNVDEVDLGQLFIRKIKANIKVTLTNNNLYLGDENPSFKLEITGGVYPSDLENQLMESLEFNPEIDTSVEANNFVPLNVTKVSYNGMEWTPSNTKYLDLTFDESKFSYRVTKREVVIKDDSFKSTFMLDNQYVFKPTDVTGLRSTETIKITYNKSIDNIGNNTIFSKDCVVTVFDGEKDITSMLDIRFSNENLNVLIEPLQLELYLKQTKSSYAYNGKPITLEVDYNKTKLKDSDGKDIKIQNIEISYDMDDYIAPGKYPFPSEDEIHIIKVTTEDGDVYDGSKIKFVLKNPNEKAEILKKRIKLPNLKTMLISESQIGVINEENIANYLESKITDKYFNDLLVNGDSVSSFDIKVNYYPEAHYFTYQIVNVRIVDKNGNDVTSYYDIVSTINSGFAGYESKFNDDDFE